MHFHFYYIYLGFIFNKTNPQKMSTQLLKKKIFPALLIVATIFSALYGLKKNNDYSTIKSKLKESVEQKEELQQKLDKTKAKQQKLAIKNKKLSKRIISEINKIISLKDSVNELDNDLQKDKYALTEKTYLTKKLSNKVNYLATKIDKAKSLKTNISEVATMKKRSNGKFTKTSNKNKVDAFKISFQVLENEIASSEKKRISIQVLDPENNIIKAKILSSSKKNIANKYSDELIIDYNNELLDVVSLIEVERENIKTGKYNIIIFIEGVSSTKKTFTLR